MKDSLLRAVDAKRRPMVGQDPSLRDLQGYLRGRPELRAQLRTWLEGLVALEAQLSERVDDEPTADTEDP